MKRVIRSSDSTSDYGYWYLCKHGIGPGCWPKDAKMLDYKEHPDNGWLCYVKLDKMLTTQELRDYDLAEEIPQGIEATCDILGADDSDTAAIPEPLGTWYIAAPESEVADMYGPEYAESAVEEVDGYNFKHIGFAIAKGEYLDELAHDGIDCVEIVKDLDSGDIILAYVVGDSVCQVTEDEMPPVATMENNKG